MRPAAILDIDGTLVDTNYQNALAWFRALRRHDELLPVWRIHRHIGMGGDHLVKSLCGEEVMIGDSSIADLRERVGQTPLGDGQATGELPRQA